MMMNRRTFIHCVTGTAVSACVGYSESMEPRTPMIPIEPITGLEVHNTRPLSAASIKEIESRIGNLTEPISSFLHNFASGNLEGSGIVFPDAEQPEDWYYFTNFFCGTDILDFHHTLDGEGEFQRTFMPITLNSFGILVVDLKTGAVYFMDNIVDEYKRTRLAEDWNEFLRRCKIRKSEPTETDNPLIQAMDLCDLKLFTELLEKGEPPDAKIEGTPLINFACLSSHFRMCQALLDHGVDVNSVDEQLLNTPLLRAAKSREILHLLIKRGAQINHVNKYGENLVELMFRSRAPSPDELAFYLDSGLDPKQKTKKGESMMDQLEELGPEYEPIRKRLR